MAADGTVEELSVVISIGVRARLTCPGLWDSLGERLERADEIEEFVAPPLEEGQGSTSAQLRKHTLTCDTKKFTA